MATSCCSDILVEVTCPPPSEGGGCLSLFFAPVLALSYCYLGGMPKTQTTEAINALNCTTATAKLGKELTKLLLS